MRLHLIHVEYVGVYIISQKDGKANDKDDILNKSETLTTSDK